MHYTFQKIISGFTYCLLMTLFCSIHLHASWHIGTFDNSGTWEGDYVDLDTTDVINTGKIIATEALTLTVSNDLSGSGLIEAPIIRISVKTFSFTGTINCSKTCIITTQTPFDQSMFKREGGGEFIIVKTKTTNKAPHALPPAIQALFLKH